MNKDAWKRYSMLKELAGVMYKHQGKWPPDTGSGGRFSPEGVVLDELHIHKEMFGFHVGFYGGRHIVNRAMQGMTSAFREVSKALERQIIVGLSPPATTPSVERPRRGVYKVNVPLSWYRTVWKGVYRQNAKAVSDKLVLRAEAKSLPSRQYDFFEVIFFIIGEIQIRKGWAARSRKYPNVVVVASKERVISEADKAVSLHINKTLGVLE